VTPEERVRADALITTGLEPKAVRRMLATHRPLFLKLRAQRQQMLAEQRARAAGLLDDFDDGPQDDDDRDEGHCWECGVPMFGQSGVICDECEYPF
jgi:hypothetical protein